MDRHAGRRGVALIGPAGPGAGDRGVRCLIDGRHVVSRREIRRSERCRMKMRKTGEKEARNANRRVMTQRTEWIAVERALGGIGDDARRTFAKPTPDGACYLHTCLSSTPPTHRKCPSAMK